VSKALSSLYFPSFQNTLFFFNAEIHFQQQSHHHQSSNWLPTSEPMIITNTKQRAATIRQPFDQ
jgi:hypothetical protein